MSSERKLVISVIICLIAVVAALLWNKLLPNGVNSKFSENAAIKNENPFAYPLDSLLVIDSSQIGYRQIDSIVVPIKEPRALCLDAYDRCYIAGDSGVCRLDSNGVIDTFFATSGVVHAVTIDPDGRLLAGMQQKLIRFSIDGSSAEIVIGGANTYITSIAADEEYIYIADAGKRLVWCVDTTGKVMSSIGEKDTTRGIPGLIIPSPYMDIALGHDGSLWVVNPGRHRIENYRRNGDFIYHWGVPGTKVEGFCGCCNPVSMTLLPNGSFVTAEKGIVRVMVYGPTGDFVTVVAPPAAFHSNLQKPALAVDSNGAILVLDSRAGVIRVYTKKTEEVDNG